jgi:Protein of unknown function (DUF1236)
VVGKPEEVELRTNLLLGAAAVGVLITGAIAQTSSNIERIKDPAGQQGAARESEPKRNVRTVYPNTQNAEQAARESKTAQGAADASKRPPGDAAPLPNAQQPSSQAAPPAAQPAQAPQPSAQTPGTPSAQPASAPPPSAPPQQPAPAATAASQPAAPSGPAAAQPSRAANSSVIALDTQQQTSIGQALAQRGVRPLTNITFSIAVGTKVPAGEQLRALPSNLVTFIPQYRGYSYVVVEEQVVIVDPGTHEIVAIVPYTAAAPATRTAETDKPRTPVVEKPMVNRPVNLNTEEKAASRRPAMERKKNTRSVVKREVRQERVPRTVTIEEEPIRGPAFRTHRYVDDDDDAVIVAPRQNGFFGLFR